MTEYDYPVECVKLEKRFGKTRILKNISFTIYPRTICALVGPNGSGKTTLLKILSTAIKPTSGAVKISGIALEQNPRAIRARIGFVSSEERSFYWRLTGRQNLEFFGSLYGLRGKKARIRIDEVLESVGLKDKANLPFSRYSTGMKQALGIARGVIHDPLVLIMDEPFRSLSPDVTERLQTWLCRFVKRGKKTILMASHNLNETSEIADRFIFIAEGEIQDMGNIEESDRQKAQIGENPLKNLFKDFTVNNTGIH
jgi:ABC-2 type transport system ATP-binding protein